MIFVLWWVGYLKIIFFYVDLVLYLGDLGIINILMVIDFILLLVFMLCTFNVLFELQVGDLYVVVDMDLGIGFISVDMYMSFKVFVNVYIENSLLGKSYIGFDVLFFEQVGVYVVST